MIEFTNITKNILSGRNLFHSKCINWSYLSLGKDVLIHMNKNVINDPIKQKKMWFRFAKNNNVKK